MQLSTLPSNQRSKTSKQMQQRKQQCNCQAVSLVTNDMYSAKNETKCYMLCLHWISKQIEIIVTQLLKEISEDKHDIYGHLMVFSTSKAKQQRLGCQNDVRLSKRDYLLLFTLSQSNVIIVTFMPHKETSFKPVRIIFIVKNVYHQKAGADAERTFTSHILLKWLISLLRNDNQQTKL